MAPCGVDQNAKVERDTAKALNLASIRKAIPADVFEKSTFKSATYMVRDYACLAACTYGIYSLCNSSLWAEMPFWQQALATTAYWNAGGFFMWCIFMIGHDCGHTNFSPTEWVNDMVGHIAHGSILVPYHPWQLSHRRHHMYHNHEDKDYSHPWYTPERLARPDEGTARMMHNNSFIRVLFPFYGWHIYLYGLPDGSHYFPFTSQRMWAETSPEEKKKCILSTAVVAANLFAIIYACGSASNFAYYYLGPYVMFGWWLVTVTYLQHHDHKTLVYTDEDWSFVTAAFETVDRTFGFGIDAMHHHITDGHVAHHLFFKSIPHYNLPKATVAIQAYLEKNNLSHMYKHDECRDFVYRVHKYFVEFGFKAHRAASKKVE